MARVLVVDDSEDLQDAYELILTSEGHEVSRASDGLAGLERLDAERPDVVLLDMMMPELDGLGFLEQLAQRPDPPPAIANSGFDAYRDAALARGAKAYLAKPCTAPLLLAALDSVIDQRPVPNRVLEANTRHVDEQRQQSALASAALVELIAPEAIAPLRQSLDALAGWIPAYYGFGSASIQLSRGDQLFVEACVPTSAALHTGGGYDRSVVYCGVVLDAGSTLVLCDAANHACPQFSAHPTVRGGWCFYAGVPLTTSEGCVIGTLCLLDVKPHEFHEEDIHLLEALGLEVAHALEEVATGLPCEDFVVDEAALFAPEMLPTLLEVAVQRAARRGGAAGLGLVDLVDDEAATACAVASYRAAPGPGLAVARRGRHQLAVVKDDERYADSDELAAALSACEREPGVRAVGVGWTPPLGEGELTKAQASQIRAVLFQRAAQSRARSMAEYESGHPPT